MNYDRNRPRNLSNYNTNFQQNKISIKSQSGTSDNVWQGVPRRSIPYDGNNLSNGYNLNVNQQLINYIYSTVELSRFKYKIIEYESDLTNLIKQKHFLSANFNGINCLLVFTKIRDKYYSFMVDRKTLTYNQNQINFDTVKITPVNIRLDNSIYNGTIMDGIFILNKRTRSKVFVITDVYHFMGKKMTDDNINHKFMNVTAYLESNLKNDDRINNITLTINKLYEPYEIEKLISDMEKSKGFDFRGYAFYPDKSGTKLIFLNNDSKQPPNKSSTYDISEKTEKIFHDNNLKCETSNYNIQNKTDNKNESKNRKYIYVSKTNDPIYATLELRKTPAPDVYNIFCAEKETINNKKCIILKKLGIALVPDKECSSKCKNILNKKIKGKALMKCKFNSDKNKWVPIDEDTDNKIPSLLTDIEKNLDLVLQSDTDEENE